MAYITEVTYTQTGDTNKAFKITFPFLETTDVKAKVNDVAKTITTHFTVSGTSITLSTKSLAIDSSAGSDISIAPSDYDDGWCSLMWYRNYQTRWYIRGVKPNSTLTDAPVLSSGP